LFPHGLVKVIGKLTLYLGLPLAQCFFFSKTQDLLDGYQNFGGEAGRQYRQLENAHGKWPWHFNKANCSDFVQLSN
jgi:hypothetical protein